MQKTIVLSLGGSLICPEDYDFDFLKKFKNLIEKFIKKDYKFIIICGGGKLARNFQEIASKSSKLDNEELDWLGIYATKINAHIVKSIFDECSEEFVVSNPNKKINFKKNVLIASGWKPGCSTDYDAVLIAKIFGVNGVINLSNVDFVYDKDPKKNRDAKKIEKMNWSNFIKIIGSKWTAGLNVPFDPVAAKEAKKSKMKVSIIGKDLNNLKDLLDGKKFKGTVIE
ncbi:MAG TPA: UMP kinase [Candidatus Nanoarchaeia archaeon]|nr:UMP kinase [Candidatus Nanoarchaeia archaeon]